MIDNIYEYLHEHILLVDGAMGTELYSRGVPRGHCYDELNLSMPQIVERVHRDYIAVGAKIIETNTFGANRHILGTYYDLADKTYQINEKGARIAHAATLGKDVLIAGSVGPISRPYEETEKIEKTLLNEIFTEQISALVDGGVNLILLETFGDIDELQIAFLVAKTICKDIPVICSMSFLENGRTAFGVDPSQAAAAITEAGAMIIGANCGTGPSGVFESVKKLAISKELHLAAMPNAGLPTFSDGRFDYPAEPKYMAYYASKFAGAGVSIIGGCCGSGPEHIKAMAEAIENIKPRKPDRVFTRARMAVSDKVYKTEHVKTRLERILNREFVYSMEIDPPRGVDIEHILQSVKDFKEAGGTAVNISDTPMARLRMSALPLASQVKNNIDIEVVLHVTARDRNLIAIQSDLLGAHSLGIRDILALKGDPPSIGDYPFASGVYDVTTPGLVSILSSFARGRDRLGSSLDKPADYFVGVAFNQNARNLEHEISHLQDKIRSGARFIQTQPVFGEEDLIKIKKAVPENVPILASLMILVSENHAEFLHNEVPGIEIPQEYRDRLRGLSGKEGRERGIEIASEIMESIREYAAGVCFMPPFGRYDICSGLIK